MILDLEQLAKMHPLLPPDIVGILVVRAALGLQRNEHSPGVELQVILEETKNPCPLIWPPADPETAKQHDDNKITEDGAEAIALGIAHESKSWRVVRRLQREEYADWLLAHEEDGARSLIALEVSGVDHGTTGPRLKEKLEQVAKSTDVDERWASVVGFGQPRAVLDSVGVTK
jgi:hypothetical protein